MNNAGSALDGFDVQVVHESRAFNGRGPIAVTRTLMQLVLEHAGIVMVSSGMGELSGFDERCRDRFSGCEVWPKEILRHLGVFEDAVRRGTHREEGWPSAAHSMPEAALNAYGRWLAAADGPPP